MGEKSAANLISAIEERKNPEPERVIFALGIRQIGQATARLLAQRYGSIDSLMQAALNARDSAHEDYLNLIAIDQIGLLMAQDIIRFFSEQKNQSLVKDLMRYIQPIPPEQPTQNSVISGKTIVFTGTLNKLSGMRLKHKQNGWGPVLAALYRLKLTF